MDPEHSLMSQSDCAALRGSAPLVYRNQSTYQPPWLTELRPCL